MKKERYINPKIETELIEFKEEIEEKLDEAFEEKEQIEEKQEEVAEEILAYVKESRYTDATELWAKTKREVSEIMQQVRNEKRAPVRRIKFQMRVQTLTIFFVSHHPYD